MADAEAEEFTMLLGAIKQMQGGTTALVRASAKASADLAISNVKLGEDLDKITATPLEASGSPAGEPLEIHVQNDIVEVNEATSANEGMEVSLVLRLRGSATCELVFATDEECKVWGQGLAFLKGCLPGSSAAPAAAPAARPTPRQAAPASSADARIAELEAQLQRKEATIQQLLKESRDDDAQGMPTSAESDVHMKDRLIARLRSKNADLKQQLAKKDKIVRKLVSALHELQQTGAEESESDDEVPAAAPRTFAPAPRAPAAAPGPTRAQPARPESPTGRLPAMPPQMSPSATATAGAPAASEEAQIDMLNSFIHSLGSKFDGLEEELQSKTKLLSDLQNEEASAKAEHAMLLQQLKELEAEAANAEHGMPSAAPARSPARASPARASPAKPAMAKPTQAPAASAQTDEAELEAAQGDLSDMQAKVDQLQSLLAMLEGANADMEADQGRVPVPRPAQKAPVATQASNPAPNPAAMAAAMAAMAGGMADMSVPGDGAEGMSPGELESSLEELEAKKRQIEGLAQMLGIDLDADE